MTTFTSDNFGINTVSGSLLGNQYLNLAAQLTDDDLLNSEEIQIDWPSTDSRLNHCTVKFFNESENFKEDSASWPPKVSGTVFKGIGGKLYKPQSGWDDTGSSTARLLNNLAVWGGTETDGADSTPPMSWAFAASASDSCTLEIAGDDSITVILYNITNELNPVEVINLSATFPNTNFLSNIQLILNTKYRIVVYGSDSGSLQGVAGRLYGTTSGIEYWSTRAIAYDSVEIQNQSNSIYTYFLEQDNGVELEDSVNMDGIVDYYHALAKAEERVRTSRSAVSVKFKYIIKNKFLEPGDYIRLDSVKASLENLYLRIDEISLEDGGTCSVTATRFDWTQLAWNVKDDQLILPTNIYNFEIDSPTNVTLNSADTTLEGTIGKLSWSGVFSEVTGYIVYIAPVVNNQIGEYQEIGRTNNTYFSVPPFNYANVAFGVRSYTTLGKKSAIVSTGILQVTQNYKRDLTISSNHLVFIQEAYTANFTTPSIVLTAVARGFSNPTYQWYLNDQLISGSAIKTLQIEPYLGAPRYYKARVSEFKPGVGVATEVLEYTVLIQSRKESIRATINTNPSLPPSPPTNFNITALYNSIRLTWTIPVYAEGGGHGYTDVYYAPMTNSFENWTAIQTGLTQAANNQTPGSTIFKEVFNGRMLGDIDNSNFVTSADATIITNFLAGTATEAQQIYINQVLRPQLQTDITGKYSAYFNYNTQSTLTTLLSSLIKISSVEGSTNSYIFSGDPNTNYLFALKEVNREGVESTTLSNRLGALTSPNSTKLLQTLSSKIDSTQLSTTLNSRVNLIDAPTTGLVTKVSTLETTTSILNTSVTTLSAKTDSVSQYGEGFSSIRSFNFDSSTEGFVGSNATVSTSTLYNLNTISLASNNVSAFNAILTKTLTLAERFNGSAGYIVRMRLKRNTGDSNIAWLGQLRYSTPNHGYLSTYFKDTSLPTGVSLISVGVGDTDWFVVEWDMRNLPNGGTDWTTNTITGLSFYLHNSQQATWLVDWIAIGVKSVNLYQALYNQEVIVRAAADSALSSQVTIVQASVGGLTTSVQQKMTARAVDGTLQSEYSVVIDNNGIISGFGLATDVDDSTGVASSIFGVNADKFFIANPAATNTRVKPFVVTDGIVYIDTARIQDGSITNAKIGSLSADRITSGFINVDRLDTNSITAAKIDSRGLSIKDANGNILFNAGSSQPLAADAVSGLGALATKSTVTTSEITGLGTFATKSSLDYTEVSGTKPPSDANNTYIDTDGTIKGVSAGSGTSVSNAYINKLSLVSSGVTVGTNSVVKLSGSSAWDSQAYSKEYYYKNVYLSFVVSNSNRDLMVGLNTDPATNASYTSLDYAFYFKSDNTISIYESEVDRGTFGNYTTGDSFTITYDGVNIIYYKNGVPLRTIAANITNPLYFDSSFYSIYGSINNIKFGPLAEGLNLTEINNIKTNATDAINGLATKLNNNARNLLSGPGGFATGNLNWDANGVRTSGYGIGFTTKGIVAYNSAGNATFTLDGDTGAATFKGDITGASGSFSGSLNAATGTFSGSLSAATGTFSGSLTAQAINAVNTINIANQAVTIPVSVSTASSIVISSTAYVTVQSISYVSTGAPVFLMFAHQVSGTTYNRMWTRVIRDDNTVLYEKLNFGAAGSAPFDCAFVNDTPSAGTRTYTMQCARDSLTSNSNSVIQRQMFLIETKK